MRHALSRSFRDRYQTAVHHAGEVKRNGGNPLSFEQLRRIGITPKGFKSSPPKAAR